MVKKLNIVCILLVFIFSLSAVSAADNITDDVSTIANANENVVIDNTTTVSETSYSNDVLSDSVVSSDDSITENQENTYADLADKINNTADNSTVELNENYAYNNSDFQNYQKGIVITDNVTINGNNHNITVTGSDSAFIIKNAAVTLENINFKGTTYESVVQVIDGQLTLLNCTIEDINKVSPTAGAIGDTFSVNDILTIANHVENYYKATNTLPNNVVYNGKSYTLPVISQLLGQAVLNYYANNTADISVTKLLSAPGNPFGSFNSSINYTQKAYITNSESIEKGGFTLRFVNYCNKNNAPPNYVGANDGNLYYTSLVESFARALVYYGANTAFPEYMNYYGNIKIASSTSGVGVYSYNSNLTIKNSIIKNISGSTNGGIYVLYGNILVNNTIFDSNTASRGAAIFVDSATSVNIDNSKFTNNTATLSKTNGIVINTYMTSVNITNSNFTDNNGSSMRGLIELNKNSESFVDNCIFNNNKAGEAVGIAADSSKKITITNSKFMNNGASDYTGFGCVFNSQATPMEIKNSEFINNSVTGGHPWGGVGVFISATFDIINSTFINNTAREPTNSTDGDKNLGGAIYAQTGAIVNIVNSTFIENSAANKGGALYAQGSSNFIISGSKFINNTANNYGGALYSKEAYAAVSVDDSYFENNSALNGGAISTESYSSSDVDNSTFVGNNANTGGAIYGDGTVNVKNSYFQNNYALNHNYNNGGALSAQTLSLEHSTFVNNSAKQGGAVWVGSSSKIYNSTFINNKADDGSAISLCYLMSSTTVNYNIFVNNTGNHVIYDKGADDTINLNYNYWGTNDDPNSLVNKTSTKTILDKWITIGIEGNSTINAGSEYNYNIIFQGENADKLPLFNTNITLVPNVGTLNQSNILLNNKTNVGLSANKAANFTLVIGPEYGNLATYNIESLKINSTIVASAESITYGNDAIVNVVVPSDATGNVTITVNEVTKIVNITNGKANATFNGLNATSYPVSVTYNGDDKYLTSTNTTTLTVNQASSNVDVSVDNVVYGGNVTIVATVTPGATGNVTFTVNGVNRTVNIIDGKATLNVTGLIAGNYPVEVIYNGDNNYKSSTNTSSFNVTQANSNINVSVDNVVYGNNATIVATVTPGATGNVTFTVNGVNRTVNLTGGKATFDVSDLVAGNYPVEVTYNGDNNYKSSTNTSSFNVTQANSNINVSVDNVVYGNNATIVATVTPGATGNVTFTVNGVNRTVNLTDGKATFDVSDLVAGNYPVEVTYNGDNNYKVSTNTTSFNVTQAASNIGVSVDNVVYGNNATIVASLPKDATGNVTFTVNDKSETVNITNGKATLNVGNLSVANYPVEVTYNGDNNYKVSKNTTSFNVTQAVPKIDINVPGDLKIGDNVTIVASLPKDVTGNVTLSIDGKNISVAIKDGVANLTVSNLSFGSHQFKVEYDGDNNYKANNESISFYVDKFDSSMSVDIPEIISGENATITVSLPKHATGNVTLTINNNNYTANVTNGVAKVNIPGLDAGSYNVTVTYSGDNEYKNNVTKYNITVLNNKDVNLNSSDIVMFYKDGTRFVGILTDYKGNPIANQTLTFTINGRTYIKTTDVNGTASIALNLIPGAYNANVYFNGTKDYNSASVNVSVTIKSTIEGSDIVKIYQNGTQFFATFYGADGKTLANKTNVTFNINGVFYTRQTNENGTAKLNINLNPGNYTLTAINPVNNETKGFNVLVKSSIEANDLTKYYQNASKFEAKIYDKDGSLAINKTVEFNINGVVYKRDTDENGIARLAINLRPGNYTITTMYDGLSVGNNVNVLPTLETKDLSMKFQDGSKFSAITLDDQGKPLANQNVTFNVNGVFYNRTSNENGVANLNINLMPGEYIITSMWKGFETANKIKID